MRSRNGIRAILIGLLALALLPASASAAPQVSGEFAVEEPLNANNRIVEGPEGDMWVTLTTINAAMDVARIDPESGKVDEFDLPGVAGAYGITSAAGKLWITQDGVATTGFAGFTQFDPQNPPGTVAVRAVNGAADVPTPIVAGPDGNVWMAVQGNLVRISPSSLDVTAIPVGIGAPRDLDVVGSSLVIADLDGKRIVTATPTDPSVTKTYPTPVGSQGVAGSPSGQIAFTQPPKELGLLTPPGSPLYTPSLMPNQEGTDAFGVTLGPDDAFWFAQFVPNSATRLSTDNEASTLSPGFAPHSGPRQIAAGPNHTLWVTLDESDRIGRISGVEGPPEVKPPPPPEPNTRIDKGPKARVLTTHRRATVKFRFSSPDAGASFECRLTKLKAAKKKPRASKAPAFAPCKSPKTYRLKPGRYRFEVRAVRGGVVDKSPVTRSFHVIRVFPADVR